MSLNNLILKYVIIRNLFLIFGYLVVIQVGKMFDSVFGFQTDEGKAERVGNDGVKGTGKKGGKRKG